MKYRIDEHQDALEIEVSDVAGKEGQLMAAFQACRDGHCNCPTREYQKLASMDVEPGQAGIKLRLKARDGQVLDAAEIKRCLEFTEGALDDPDD